MLFAIEEIAMIGITLTAFMTVTDRFEMARWLSKQEKELAIARIKSERIATSEVF